MDPATYWAAETDPTKLVARVRAKFARSLDLARRSGQLDRTQRMLLAYYSQGAKDATKTKLGGKQGELAVMVHNGVRPLIAQILALVCGQRPGLKPVATNTDASCIAEAELADGVRQHYERTLEIPQLEVDVARGGYLGAQHWAVLSWKRTKGEAYAVDADGALVYEGGIELLSLPWWRAAADPLARRPVDRSWYIFRRPANRFDLAGEYPAHAAELLTGTDVKLLNDWGNQLANPRDFEGLDELFGDVLDPDDGVWLWELRHLPTPALPNGRLVRFVSGDCVLFDSANFTAPGEAEQGDEQAAEAMPKGRDVGYPYKELHAYDFAPERVVGTARGHTGSWDTLGVQEMLDVCTTTVATVVNLFGRPHLWAGPAGAAGINAAVMSSGPVVLETKSKPEVLKFEALSSDVTETIGLLRDLMRESGSLNKTVMGEIDKGMPGNLAALQRAQAVQVHQTAQGEYFRLVENIATGCLALSQRFARTTQTAEIAGKGGAYELKKWSQKDVANVPRFSLELVNPLTQSFEGRQAEAEFLATQGWISKQGYLALKSTGSLKEPLEAEQSKLELVAQHKELLRQGIGLPPIDMQRTEQALMANPAAGPVFVDDGQEHVRLAKYDPHWLTIPEYAAVLFSPAARENPAIVEAVDGVVRESLRLWASLTPDELAVLGGQPLPSQLQASTPAGPPAPMRPATGGSAAQAPKTPGEPALPEPPKDPITQNQQGAESLNLPT